MLKSLYDQTMCKANENLNHFSGVGGGLTVNVDCDVHMMNRPNGGWTYRVA